MYVSGHEYDLFPSKITKLFNFVRIIVKMHRSVRINNGLLRVQLSIIESILRLMTLMLNLNGMSVLYKYIYIYSGHTLLTKLFICIQIYIIIMNCFCISKIAQKGINKSPNCI